MTTMVIKATGTISNPNQNNVIVGSIVTSDKFTGSGLLVGQKSDALLGGEKLEWKKFSAYPAGVFEKVDGMARIVVGVIGAVYLDKALVDVAVQFKVAKLDSGLGTDSIKAFIDVRRIDANLKMYRLGFNDAGINLIWRDGASTTLITTPTKVGDEILYVAKGTTHKIYVNSVLKIDINHVGTEQSGNVGFSGATDKAAVGFSDLIVYSV